MKKSINRRITIYFLIIMVFTAVFSAVWNLHRTCQSILETEQITAQTVPFGPERLLEALHPIPHGPKASEEVLRMISRSVSAYCEGVEPFDDLAAMALFMAEALPE